MTVPTGHARLVARGRETNYGKPVLFACRGGSLFCLRVSLRLLAFVCTATQGIARLHAPATRIHHTCGVLSCRRFGRMRTPGHGK